MNIANESYKTQCLFYADFLRFLKDKNIFKKFMFNYLNGWRYKDEKKVFLILSPNFINLIPMSLFIRFLAL